VGFDVSDQLLITSFADLQKTPRTPRFGNFWLRPWKTSQNKNSILNTSAILLKNLSIIRGEKSQFIHLTTFQLPNFSFLVTVTGINLNAISETIKLAPKILL
jgi:hypothetical protein